MAKRLVIFLHIPKTGGSTMRQILDRQYGPLHILNYSPKTSPLAFRRPGISAVYGHFRYGLHQHSARKPVYITILRDPLDRVLSTYYYIRSRPQNKMYHKVKNMSLMEFVTSTEPRIRGPLHNHQTRLISGKKHPDLKTAIRNINNDFPVVGVTEMYPESVFMMKKALGWNDTFYTKQNVNRQRRKKTEVPNKVKQIVRKNNELDYKLYNYAKKRLFSQIRNLDPQSKRQLAAFKRYLSRR